MIGRRWLTYEVVSSSEATSGSETRAEKHYEIVHRVKILWSNAEAAGGVIVDISQSGASVRVAQRLEGIAMWLPEEEVLLQGLVEDEVRCSVVSHRADKLRLVFIQHQSADAQISELMDAWKKALPPPRMRVHRGRVLMVAIALLAPVLLALACPGRLAEPVAVPRAGLDARGGTSEHKIGRPGRQGDSAEGAVGASAIGSPVPVQDGRESAFLIPAETRWPAVMVSGPVSWNADGAIAELDGDVLGHGGASQVLLPNHTRLIGTLAQNRMQTEMPLGVIWTRAELPNGAILKFVEGDNWIPTRSDLSDATLVTLDTGLAAGSRVTVRVNPALALLSYEASKHNLVKTGP